MSDRRAFVAGNWKLHNTVPEALALGRALRNGLLGGGVSAEVAIAPVATALYPVAKALEGSPIKLCAQNVHYEEQGAFTGELSPRLLADVGCTHCIVGHSERRQLFGEKDEGIRRKVEALLERGLVPILCVGETLEEREAGATERIVLGQLDAGLSGLEPATLGTLIVAYEPVWAIGTGRTASPADAQDVHAAIRTRLGETKGRALADGLRILYGGSVKPSNAAELMGQPDIDGALVGGASLSAETFLPIVQAAR